MVDTIQFSGAFTKLILVNRAGKESEVFFTIYKQALANVEVIIHEWIETAKDLKRAVPEPKGRLLYA